MILNMGPQHPSTHGVLRVLLEIDGETIVRIMPDIGFLHTGIEKTSEAKFYQQVVPLTDRIDYLCPMTNMWVYEGMTQYWGNILTARAGMRTAEQTRDILAYAAAQFAASRGRDWRPLVDTTDHPIPGTLAPCSNW